MARMGMGQSTGKLSYQPPGATLARTLGQTISPPTKIRGEPIMRDAPGTNSYDEINAIFAHLDRRDVEQFYASYQLWILQQHIAEVQARIQSVTQQIAENQEHLQRVHPSAIALATLARLQSNGVND